MAEELFRDFWWLMFPIFGMVMCVLQTIQSNRRADDVVSRSRRELEGK